MWAPTTFALAILGAIVLVSLAVRSLFLCVKSPGDVFLGILLAVIASVCVASLPFLFFQTVRKAAVGAVHSTKDAVVRNVRQGRQEVLTEAQRTVGDIQGTATTAANDTLNQVKAAVEKSA